ncbi:MAG: cytochrome c oxidase assembly protein [Gemmataceae bacterium]|nr:cytochrome c oxidase assembly protein [Gemmataceae bacterium]
MMPVLDAALRSWPADPWLWAGLLLTALVYLRGWRVYHRHDPGRWGYDRLAAFFGGLMAIFLALGSPVEPFAGLLLSVHMVQHLLLVMVAPPLLWLGAPLLPMVRGLPEPVRAYWVGPLFGMRWLRRFASWITHPAPALVLLVVSTWAWHTPAAYELALRSSSWHYLQHLCFLAAGLVFWFPVVRPYPARPRWPVWLLVPYLLLADLSNTVLSALLTFSEVVLYPYYADVPRIGGSALDDQAAAGVLMWVPGSVAYLLPLFGIVVGLLSAEPARPTPKPVPIGGRFALPLADASPPPRFDLTRVWVVGPFLRWRYARPALQLPLLALAVLVVIDGFAGPAEAPLNLAGVLPWVHWRGLLVLCLLLAGNFFCTACPFTLPRTLARRWLPAGRDWPWALRGKWLAAGLLVVFFTAYEAWSLWDRPSVTAAIVVGYFVAAFAVDGLFRGGAFCKYVCPVGQFNFVQSLASPLEVAVRNPKVCAACTTKDCIPACELGLAQPRKRGNMDCTFCLDCVHACPHGNVGVLAGVPGRGLADDRPRSGTGRFSRRPDLAALVVVVVFAAFVNAAGMVGPVLDWQDDLRSRLGLASPVPVVFALYAAGLVVAPVLLVGGAAWAGRTWGRLTPSTLAVATRFAFALVPLGFGMWLAHYGYHLATSYDVAWPVVQRFAADHGVTALGQPDWGGGCCRGAGGWLTKAELVALDLGLLLTLYTAHAIARDLAGGRRAVRAFLPWALLAVGLFAAGVWVVLQPMQMRGTLAG